MYVYIYIYIYIYILWTQGPRTVESSPETGGASCCWLALETNNDEVQSLFLFLSFVSFCSMHTGSAPGAHGASHRRTTNCMKKRAVTASLMSAAYP